MEMQSTTYFPTFLSNSVRVTVRTLTSVDPTSRFGSITLNVFGLSNYVGDYKGL